VNAFGAFFREVLAGSEFQAHDSVMLAKDGEPRYIRLRGKQAAGLAGNPSGILLSGTDRTELHTALDELHRVRAAAHCRSQFEKPDERQVAQNAPASDAGCNARERGSQNIPAVAGGAAVPQSRKPFQPISPPKGNERRSSPRRTFQYRQLVGPVLDGRLPARNQFFEVVCEDISAGGVSFYLSSRPEYKQVVVGLGRLPHLTFFMAEIVRVVDKELDGRSQVLVGCRFTGRVKK
jgi:hypothetical protein